MRYRSYKSWKGLHFSLIFDDTYTLFLLLNYMSARYIIGNLSLTDDSPGRALGGGAWAIGPASSDYNNNGLPSDKFSAAATTTNPPPSTYRLGTKPGGLRLITDQDKDVRIIFLFDLKPVHLFRRQFIRNRNAIRNIITKDDV